MAKALNSRLQAGRIYDCNRVLPILDESGLRAGGVHIGFDIAIFDRSSRPIFSRGRSDFFIGMGR